MDDDEVLFDALEVPPAATETSNKVCGNEERSPVHEISRRRDAHVPATSVEELTEIVGHLRATIASHNAGRVEAAAQNTMLQKQLEHQWSVVKHLKQMLKNISDKYTATQVDNRVLKTQCRDKQQRCDMLGEEVYRLTEEIGKLRKLAGAVDDLESRYASLERNYQQAVADSEEWKQKANHLVGVADENAELRQNIVATTQEHTIACKRAHHIIKELRLALRQAQDANDKRALSLPAPPAASSIPFTKHHFASDAAHCDDSMDGFLQAMSSRLEHLLTQNAHLAEQVQVSEKRVHLLAADLERKRLMIQQLTLHLVVTPDEQEDVVASALATAAALEVTASSETLLYVTIKENLLLKKRLGSAAPFALSWKEPACTSFYRIL
ncbi:hypothetical protein H310_05037 [Aphanomyces invadans]|uniref:Uncharacterized protein n=1 Tax=Aphanomyces invadans TaxID=157072 RepID=A0A024UDC6_9STRA|nr:hypothetical protein H310_05037 [Aphanomyces invadans]ETW03638.1 hypothetical protein H310_05037 [Aphanomyces invadans]|eukprot:XP_008867867.1 hypothetical protein H310_05037 [Aphanomyces invadans]